MKSHRRMTWLIYAVCALLLIDGMGWVTWHVLRLERSERFARQNAELQESVRLALWRMDGMLAPIIATESGRPYFHYRAFYPESRAYSQMWEPVHKGDVLVPSPLLSGPSEYIRLHFESTPEGWLTSPQAPTPEQWDLLGVKALPLTDMLAVERELIELNYLLRGTEFTERHAPSIDSTEDNTEAVDSAQSFLNAAEMELRELARNADEPAPQSDTPPQTDEPSQTGRARSGDEPVDAVNAEAARSAQEFAARQQSVRRALSRNDAPDERFRTSPPPPVDPLISIGPDEVAVDLETDEFSGPDGTVPLGTLMEDVRPSGSGAVVQGRFTPVWRTNPTTGEAELLFVRVVTAYGRELLQGFWIDWPALRADLLALTADLLPGADLEPLLTGPTSTLTGERVTAIAGTGRFLASVPAVLSPGQPTDPMSAGLSPTRIVLVFTWLAVLAAVVAIGLVLRASVAISERRGRFVSAVTHELRTPLTTFCLYSQMLADDMVSGDDRRREYLRTLKCESERLATIVENVLHYARSSSNRSTAAEPRPVAELLDAVVPTFAERAERASMQFEVVSDIAGHVAVAADEASLERVLGNLVDNACKYARDADDRRLVLKVREVSGGVEFSLRDFGPGIPRQERRRVFHAFTRARFHADDGSSGLGLGLALAQSVARSLAGELRLVSPAGPGAEFVLWLPAAHADENPKHDRA